MFDLFYFKSIKFRRLSNEKEVLMPEVFFQSVINTKNNKILIFMILVFRSVDNE